MGDFFLKVIKASQSTENNKYAELSSTHIDYIIRIEYKDNIYLWGVINKKILSQVKPKMVFFDLISNLYKLALDSLYQLKSYE